MNCIRRFGAFAVFPRCRSMSSMANNTIFSLSSGFGKCGVAIIRVSGPQIREVLRLLTGNRPHQKDAVPSRETLRPRYAHLRELRHPHTRDLIDRGLVLWFPEPASFTGEDCCEFQVHGGLAVISAMCDALNSIN